MVSFPRSRQRHVFVFFPALFTFGALVLANCKGGSSSTSSADAGGDASVNPGAPVSGDASSSNNSDGSATGSGFRQCPGDSQATSQCSEQQLAPYTQCITGQCATQLQACYGDDYTSGTFTGPCAPVISCSSKCACDDTSCARNCPVPTTECMTCLGALSGCITKNCTLPECAKQGPGPTNKKTCASTLECCNAIADASDRQTCLTLYNNVKDNGDSACAVVYDEYNCN